MCSVCAPSASAVLTGIDTVLADDPQLNVRDPSIDLLGRQPLRVVLDTQLRMPADGANAAAAGRDVVFTTARQRWRLERAELRRGGAEVITTPLDDDGRVDLREVLQELGRRQCNDVLVEAGPTLAGRFCSSGSRTS